MAAYVMASTSGGHNVCSGRRWTLGRPAVAVLIIGPEQHSHQCAGAHLGFGTGDGSPCDVFHVDAVRVRLSRVVLIWVACRVRFAHVLCLDGACQPRSVPHAKSFVLTGVFAGQSPHDFYLGRLTTVHARAADEALVRMEGMALLAGLPLAAARSQLGVGLDIVVALSRGPDGQRGVVQVAEVSPRPDGTLVTSDLWRRSAWQGRAAA